MSLSEIQQSVLDSLNNGWVLVEGKVQEGRTPQNWLRSETEGVMKVSSTTVDALKKKDYIRLTRNLHTTSEYNITAKGIAAIVKWPPRWRR